MIYSLLRLAVLGAAYGLLYWAGLRGWPLPLTALVVALIVSYLALRTPRDAAAQWIADRAQHRSTRRVAVRNVDADHEDAQVDQELDRSE